MRSKINYKLSIFIVIAYLFSVLPLSAQTDDTPRNIQIEVEFKGGAYQWDPIRGIRTERERGKQFVRVLDGHEAKIFVGKEVPYRIWFRDYLYENGYLEERIIFRDVGRKLIVRPQIVGTLIKITVTPEISYVSDKSEGVIEVTRLSTTVMARPGEPVMIGAVRSQGEFGSHFYSTESGQAITMVLTAKVVD